MLDHRHQHSLTHQTWISCLLDEDTKAMGSMELANKALSKELEEVKGTLGLT